MKFRIHVLCISVCLGCMFLTGFVAVFEINNADTTDSENICTVPDDIFSLSLSEYVNVAAEYGRCAGKEAACAVFSDPDGPFTSDERYIFASTSNGITIAHPYNSELVKTDRLNLTDENGVCIKKTEISMAKRGGGLFYYLWQVPGTNNTHMLKLTQIEPVNDDWFVGSGIYLPNKTAVFPEEDREELASFVARAHNYAQENGFDKATAEFSDPNGEFIEGELYIYAYDRDCLTVAHPFQPELIGTDRTNFTDSNGVELIKNIRDVAYDWDGGYTYFIYVNPDNSFTEEMKLGYVLPVDDYWFIGSGIYQKNQKA